MYGGGGGGIVVNHSVPHSWVFILFHSTNIYIFSCSCLVILCFVAMENAFFLRQRIQPLLGSLDLQHPLIYIGTIFPPPALMVNSFVIQLVRQGGGRGAG